MTAKKFLTIGEFCDLFAVSRSTFYRQKSSGALNSVKIGRAVRIPTDEAEKWADALRGTNDN